MNRAAIIKQAKLLLYRQKHNEPKKVMICLDDEVEITEGFVGSILNFRLRDGEYFDEEENKWKTEGREW